MLPLAKWPLFLSVSLRPKVAIEDAAQVNYADFEAFKKESIFSFEASVSSLSDTDIEHMGQVRAVVLTLVVVAVELYEVELPVLPSNWVCGSTARFKDEEDESLGKS